VVVTEAREIWKSAQATRAAAEVTEDGDEGELPDIYAEELEYDVDLRALDAMSEHEAAEGDVRRDGRAISVEMRPQFIETATGKHIPMGNNKDIIKIDAILDHRSSKSGRQYLVRWADLQQPTWEDGVNLSPTAVEAYEAERHGKKMEKAQAAIRRREMVERRKLAKAVAAQEKKDRLEQRRLAKAIAAQKNKDDLRQQREEKEGRRRRQLKEGEKGKKGRANGAGSGHGVESGRRPAVDDRGRIGESTPSARRRLGRGRQPHRAEVVSGRGQVNVKGRHRRRAQNDDLYGSCGFRMRMLL
jgi:hypothetical protein